MQAVLARQPDLAQAHYGLGAIRYTLGDHAGAIEAYRQVLRLRPDYADAHYHLGLVLKLTNQDEAAAAEFLAAAASGLPQAQYFIGSAYASGVGVERDLAAAIEWWFRAADQHVAEAKEALAQLRGVALVKGSSSAEDARAALGAFAAFRKSLWRRFPDLPADGDDSMGVSLLKHGRGKDAVPLLIREADALSDPAQSALEVLYEQGLPGQIEPHDPRILTYWKTAAEESLPRPRLALARIYARGLGVAQDLPKAAGLLKGLAGDHARELLKEISARQHDGVRAARNPQSEPGPSP
ncbi:MAG: tetratricopeptide repeat protein [Nitrospiraceae bacterium]